MSKNIFAGKWKQLRGEIKKQWGLLTDNDLSKLDGDWNKFVGMIQERYGKSREEADAEAKKFFESMTA